MQALKNYNKKHINLEEVYALVDKALETSGAGFPFYVHDIKGSGPAAVELLEKHHLITYIHKHHDKALSTYIVSEKGIEVLDKGGIKVFLELEAAIKKIPAVTPRSRFTVVITPDEGVAPNNQLKQAKTFARVCLGIALVSLALACWAFWANR
ncbi:hypothetical protein SAMN05421788_103241 [Filimonas lacunae]|uniref:Uncharacterized protein n=1 Tax=Filimonas lacunae TaxID=477680 RepID=A0A173MK95_9BACT|nr:hypothetical protein [Filimonas lacunae]BAV07896.1 hypothetical protein FLA_3927 [Filimonas lacunae]SIT06153.1 hypothetical protein SAMN05421788_103241 [Filimonas lacunae]